MKSRLLTAAMGSAIAIALSSPAQAQVNLITNGSFESGLAGWTTSGLGSPTGTCPSAGRDWNVSTTGTATGCTAVANPIDGTRAAYNMFDGPGNMNYTLSQSFIVPMDVTAADLTFMFAAINADPNREFGFRLLSGSTTLFQQAVFSTGNVGWTGASYNLASVLGGAGGQALTLQYYANVPGTWQGPAGLGLDAVALNATATVTPEPVTLTLLGSGLAGIAGAARRRRRQQAAEQQ